MQTILVIEDDESIRSNILKILQMERFNVVAAANGRIGLQMVNEHLPDLILCDIAMPELDGYIVRRTLNQDSATATIPFIFMSEMTDKADIRLGMNLGADDYMIKPFTREELLDTIFARLDKKAAIEGKFKEKIDKLRDSITNSLPYELLTPLKQIEEFLQTLTDKYESIDRQHLIEMIQETSASNARLQKLSHNFLSYALLEIIAKDPEQIEVLLTKCSSETEGVITDVATEKAKQVERQADLQLELQNATLPILEANLAKIVEEIIDNAFKFSPNGTPVRIVSNIKNDMFNLHITNQGHGMAAEQIASLGAYMQFERTINKQAGSGLGLAIAKLLTVLHGGELTINSTPDRETTVHVALPI